MQCSACQAAMEEGFVDRGYWISGKMPIILKGGTGFTLMRRKVFWMIAWRCPSCQKVTLQT